MSTYSSGISDYELYKACEFEHPYPCTKILFSPETRGFGGRDLVATTGDYLRIWNLLDDGKGRGTLISKKESMLNTVRDTVLAISPENSNPNTFFLSF